MPLPSFHDWLEHRVEEVPDIGNLMLLIAQSGAAGISDDRLRTVVRFAPETLADVLKSLVSTGQIVMMKVNGQMVYRVAG
jgi:hypothetical protein